MKNILFVLPLVLLFSCTGGGMDASKFLAERDSIKSVTERQQLELNELDSVMSIVALSLDSIVQTEQQLYYPQEGRKLSRKDVLNNLEHFKELLERQRKMIGSLQDSLQNRGGNTEKLTRIIAFLNQELAEKDQTIQNLRREITQKNRNIADLKKDVEVLQENVAVLDEKTKMQEQALVVQDEIINEGYVKIGTKKELQKAGILSKGKLFSKSKLDYANLRKESFMKVDLRNFSEIPINSKSIKILTAMPEDSYTIVKAGDSVVLRITNPASFWSISYFLVIQID